MIRVLHGDCREVLPTLAANSVHCVVTSPPYYGLRDYGTAQWDGGDANCPHVFARQDERLMLGSNGTLGKNCTSWTHRDATPPRQCSCGARRIDRQIGLEATPDEYIQTMVAVFREVRRVLRDDGTCWVNMGDSFSGGNNVGWRPGNPDKNGGNSNRDGVGYVPGLAAKQLLMMPARLAIALQADGWWLRSDIIWAKPNPMPESVTDRPTSAHEHVFLLTKSARYYYDADAVREEASYDLGLLRSKAQSDDPRVSWCAPSIAARQAAGIDSRTAGSGYRNLRNVWSIATHSFPDAHFATYPPELVERCIKAGCPRDGTVLDPFAGAGTTMLVADRLQRHAIGIELNEAYAMMARNRIVADAPLFAEVAD